MRTSREGDAAEVCRVYANSLLLQTRYGLSLPARFLGSRGIECSTAASRPRSRSWQPRDRGNRKAQVRDSYRRSKRSASLTLTQAAAKSLTNFSLASSPA